MEEAKTTSKANPKTKRDPKERIITEYKKYVLLNGHDPHSVFSFVHDIKMQEQEFYDHFSSFKAVVKEIWRKYFVETKTALIAENAYASYSAREKLLAFYYTLLEVLKTDRSYVRYTWDQMGKRQPVHPYLDKFKQEFRIYINDIIGEGIEHEEIIKRPIIGDRYFEGVWVQFVFIVNYWLNDDSSNFENSDAAIEKSVNLSFELMGKSTIDSVIDLAKFLYNTRK